METILNSSLSGTVAATAPKQLVEKTFHFSDGDLANPKLSIAANVSTVLQTTLDLGELLNIFSTQIKPAIPHVGLIYRNDASQVIIELGSIDTYQCQYKLAINSDDLGFVTLNRDYEFSTEETKVMEYVLGSLVYPLRNAMMYRDALQKAHKDPLTGVYNRATLEETLARETKLAQRYLRPLSLIILDIDHFKKVNDTLGHAMGDCVIKATVERTASCIRSTDILFRFGGEEFVILLSNTDIAGAKHLAERIRKSIETTPAKCGENETCVTVSLGVSELAPQDTASSLFVRTDEALYRAKNNGRNRTEVA